MLSTAQCQGHGDLSRSHKDLCRSHEDLCRSHEDYIEVSEARSLSAVRRKMSKCHEDEFTEN